MWQRVVDKFSKPGSVGKLGWTGFRLDNRLHRVLEHRRSVLRGNKAARMESLNASCFCDCSSCQLPLVTVTYLEFCSNITERMLLH